MPFCSLPTRPTISMALLAALLLGACGPTTTAAPVGTAAQAGAATAAPPTARASLPATAAPAPISGPQIVIGNFTFTPNALTVAVGTTITWVNHDDTPHTVTAQDHSFTSSGLDTDDSFTHQFMVAGTYAYYCTIHTKMTATIIVR
jgi:plastocyanin